MNFRRWVISTVFTATALPLGLMATVVQDQTPPAATTDATVPVVQPKKPTKKLVTAETPTAQQQTKTIESLSRSTRRLDKGYLRLVAPGKPYFETLPGTTFDLQLLKYRNNFAPRTLNLGGYLEFDSQYWNTDSGGIVVGPSRQLLPKTGSGIYATTVDLDTLSNLNDYTTAFAKVEEEDIGTPEAHMIFRKALVNFGNLDKSPFFATVGKTYLPFGVYGGGGVWSVPMTRAVFRPSEVPLAALGYYKDGFNSNLAVFNNSAVNKEIADYVYSIYFAGAPEYGVGYTLGAGYMNDIRATPSALGAAYKSAGELDASKRVPAVDLNAEASYLHFDLTGEYMKALRQGTYNDNVITTGQDIVSPGEAQGIPAAWAVGGSYTQPFYGKPMYYSLSYSKTYHMAGVPMGWSAQPIPGPVAVEGIESAWIASIARSIEDNFILGFEFNRSHTYDSHYGDAYTLDLSMYF